MPDLSIEYAVTCASNIDWGPVEVESSNGKSAYNVSWGRNSDSNDALFGWHCECKGFQYRGTCRHMKQVEASGKRCGWNGTLEPGLSTGINDSCPDCGGETMVFKVAV